MMRPTLVVGTLVIAACYTDRATPVTNHPSEPMQQHACGANDDVAHPPLDPEGAGRMRTHITGGLSANPRYRDHRSWVGAPVPAHVPQKLGNLELFLLDEADGGQLALYREPYDLGSCGLSGAKNCAYETRFFRGGKLVWTLVPNELMSRTDHLEIQDIRLADGVLYFNEACQSYSSGAAGQCSRLVAIDPVAHRVLWRTAPLVSNSRFAIRGCYIVSGYGFTSEPDAVFLVERATGKVRQKVDLPKMAERITLTDPQHLVVTVYGDASYRFRLDGFDTTGGTLVPLDDTMAGYGGAGYGGIGYGGATYGAPQPRRKPRRP
jgi:hypothetical protein